MEGFTFESTKTGREAPLDGKEGSSFCLLFQSAVGAKGGCIWAGQNP